MNVNRNKKGIGLLVAGEKGTKTDWFKIRLTRKQKVTFTFTARANDHLRLQIVPADPKLFIWALRYMRRVRPKKYRQRMRFRQEPITSKSAVC